VAFRGVVDGTLAGWENGIEKIVASKCAGSNHDRYWMPGKLEGSHNARQGQPRIFGVEILHPTWAETKQQIPRRCFKEHQCDVAAVQYEDVDVANHPEKKKHKKGGPGHIIKNLVQSGPCHI